MTYYIGVVHKDADSSYGIAFPDLPGCFSAGEDLSELERNAIEAIDLFLEGEDVALYPARDMNAIRDGLEADDRTAMLMAVPFMRSGGRTVRVNFTVDAATLAAIDAAAKRRNLSRSAFLVSAAHNEIAGH
ncbi:HicB_like antitoxin of toxin-antitoxin system [Sphingomonas sp. OV641]|uniref:type II toxin-antitoxin system HicB family antitoxin n=1 Tax=Sphingomonas sp. OV641 TaxID=1881068 RepID=UPI0008C3EB17|nr:type II toxin-antitoxin system HicB family antitoxin [Sphingomonas sp. OV641]SEI88008.1 HicB_like antitoxin of toxin-antitoxin system [Sphingomonas sp. OV641]